VADLARVLAFVAVIAISLVGLAALKPPAPAPSEAGNQQQRATGQENGNSYIKNPLLINCHTLLSQPDGTEKTTCEYSESPPDRWSRIFAVVNSVLAGLTLGVIALQLRVYWRQANIMDTQTQILKKQQSITVGLERPYVYGLVSTPGLAIEPRPGRPQLRGSTLELSIYNYGKTPANLTRIEHRISVAQTGGIAPPIDPSVVGGRELPVGTIAVSEKPYIESENLMLCFLEESSDIVELKKSVWIVGFVRYSDIFGDHYITGFTLVFDPIGRRFTQRGSEQYNYARKEDPKTIPPKSS
jgi:hypothetical protein